MIKVRLLSFVEFMVGGSKLQGKFCVNHNLSANLGDGLVYYSAFLNTDCSCFAATEDVAYSGDAVNVTFFRWSLLGGFSMATGVGCLS